VIESGGRIGRKPSMHGRDIQNVSVKKSERNDTAWKTEEVDGKITLK
jgi:hypothetical protein